MRGLFLAWLPVLSGCMTMDWVPFNPTTTDAYVLDFEAVPAELVEEVSFENSDGDVLYGVWAHQDPPATPLIYFHGNAENIDTYLNRVEYYWGWGFDVFIFDYRGFGRSEGTPSRAILETDGLDAASFVLDSTGAAAEEVLWACESLGGSVCIHTNDELPARALLLDSVFSGAKGVADDSARLDLPAGWFFEDHFDNVAEIRHITAPVLLAHGKADDFIPPAHIEDLFAAAPDPKVLWRPAGVGHADIIKAKPEEYRAHVEAFVGDLWPAD